ncbi:hypothetical protein FGE12_09415 [Aggregicoccus sp. 17bor-14]|uniref:GDSL-type esterase/lipase family protein n=1 Tax=Myxococcaceae TaxID=31 RepID=UPI00129C578D|nr:MULTISPECIES: GDSL-type esterase/lipase family protein [Myxococcaceae]MBF5042618.1 hypothetical protein [Simulacricoccus sp. 17bor-14]MRI88386.1 hypothetical protein [Aggregicoccus sp. 17bor-14]
MISNTEWHAHHDRRLEQFRQENAALSRREGTQVVFLGDSLTEAFAVQRAFPERCVVNRGINSDHLGGTQGRGLLARISPELLAPAPSDVFVLAGVNDLGDRPDDVEGALARFRDLLQALRASYPDVRLWVQSLLPARAPYAHLNEPVRQLNARLRPLAAELGATYLDLHDLLSEAHGELDARLSRDGLHLTPRAYAIWSALLARSADLGRHHRPLLSRLSARGAHWTTLTGAWRQLRSRREG